jgi:hypothetical protein
MKKLQGVQFNAWEGGVREPLGIIPLLVPIGPNSDYRTLRDSSISGFPCLDIRQGGMIAGVFLYLFMDIDYYQRPDGIGCGKIADGCTVLVEMCRRVQLCAVLIGDEFIGSAYEAVLLVIKRFAQGAISFYFLTGNTCFEFGISKTGPNRDCGTERMGKVYIFGLFEDLAVDIPELSIGALCIGGYKDAR